MQKYLNKYKHTEVGVIPEDWDVKELGEICFPSKTRINPITTDKNYKCSEQSAIATVLSDTDALISNLEKLISKKRLIKQGAMQQLLKPKKGWAVKKLGEVFSITAGGDLNFNNYSLIQDENYRYPIYSNALTNKGLYGFTSEYKQTENTITVTARGQVGVANPRDHKYSAIGRVIILNPITNLNINFIAEYINNFIEFSNESTGVPQLTAPQISKYEILFPKHDEQTEIATILSDMDNGITDLEKKLDKYKKIKQGMMQVLLTGKIRLV
jgi:type I restriction enzyme S subunit